MEPLKHEKIKLAEINSYLTCYLCKGYLIDATTISECLHSFCRSCIIKFLQVNCYCPVCEVIINKAKPCLKLDKTLQDIVYKLVPELFIKEMVRRRQFYGKRPEMAANVSPEQRGEDTERTIFNPQDAISLSIEYVSDDSTPGAISVIPPTPLPDGNGGKSESRSHVDNPMKRYLQCPGMCRIEVLKKFVRNKYNVDTNLFYIDILYKRVPLPDHYTLIDIGYIYSWKRNEPMKFFFRITDINKVSERFDYFDRKSKSLVDSAPTAITPSTKPPSALSRVDATHELKTPFKTPAKNSFKTPIKASSKTPLKISFVENGVGVPSTDKKKVSPSAEASQHRYSHTHNNNNCSNKGNRSQHRNHNQKVSTSKRDNSDNAKDTNNSERVKSDRVVSGASEKTGAATSANTSQSRLVEEIKSKIQSGVVSGKRDSPVYTNITLNRADNVEIITKVQKVSNKEGHPIGLNIINHTVKKSNNITGNNSNSKVSCDPTGNSANSRIGAVKNNPSKSSCEDASSSASSKIESTIKNGPSKGQHVKRELDREKYDIEKAIFLKSVSLTRATNAVMAQKAAQKAAQAAATAAALPGSSASVPGASALQSHKESPQTFHAQAQKQSPHLSKRKSASPRNSGEKRSRGEKRVPPVKIIIHPKSIQPKNIANPAVRQMMTNVNQNANTMSKIVERTNTNTKNPADLQSLISNCKLTIPKSLSITINANGEKNARTPPLIPPVNNYIEILKIGQASGPTANTNKREDAGTDLMNSSSSSPLTVATVSPSSSAATTKTTSLPSKSPNNVSNSMKTEPQSPPSNPSNLQSFQKIFEESIKKSPESVLTGTESHGISKETIEGQVATTKAQRPLDLSGESTVTPTTPSSCMKRTFPETPEVDAKRSKIAIPRLSGTSSMPNHLHQNLGKSRNMKSKLGVYPPARSPTISSPQQKYHQPHQQTSANLHSTSLGLSYTVSVGQAQYAKNPGTKVPSKLTSPPVPVSHRSPGGGEKRANGVAASSGGGGRTATPPSALSPNHLLEKYKIQNLAQLTASLSAANFAAAAAATSNPQHYAAIQHAMLKHIEHQNWLNMNQGPLLQYEKYLQSLSNKANSQVTKMHVKDN